MMYLFSLPERVPEGQHLVHNDVQPSRKLGERGFRAWLVSSAAGLEPCPCGWAQELGPHYRVAQPPTPAGYDELEAEWDKSL
jgi:hypothetical protein